MKFLTLFFAACVSTLAAGIDLPPLTPESSPRLYGKFVWADLVTDDAPRAMNFYAQLFNWRFQPIGNYFIAHNEGHPMAGILQKPRPADKPAARPRWIGYISVPNVAKAESTVKNSSGKVVVATRDFPNRGEQAIFTDPEGALFGVMRSKSGDPGDFLPDPGDWVWIQLLSRNASAAADFYKKIADYKVREVTAANRVNDYVLTSKNYARATIRTLSPERPNVNPSWLPYIRVQNVKESAARAQQFQGSILIQPTPELFDGKVAVIADPSGAAIGILEWSPELAKSAK